MKVKNKKDNLDSILIEFRRAMTDSLQEEAKKSGIPLSHFEVLTHAAKKGAITMKNVASLLNITPPSASSLVDVLVKNGWVSRAHLTKDRRTVHIILGKKAYKLFISFRKKKMSLFKKTLSKLNEKDKKDLIRILIKCIPN